MPTIENKTELHLHWYQQLRYQIPIAVIGLFLVLSSAIYFAVVAVDARKHDYAILNLAGQLRVIANNMHTESSRYKANAPRDYESYYRDLLLYAKSIEEKTNRYDEIIQAFKSRELSPALTGLESSLSCNWDRQSISQLDLSVEIWNTFKAGHLKSLGNNKQEPTLERAAEFILLHADQLITSTDALTISFRVMMQTKLDTLIQIINGLLILSLAIAIGLLALYYFKIQKPLKNSIEGIKQISNGTLDQTIEITANNELALLNHAVNNMSASLNAIFNLTTHVNKASTIDATLQAVFNEFNQISTIHWAGIFNINASHTSIKLDRLFCDTPSHLTEGQTFDYQESYMPTIIKEDEFTIINDLTVINKKYKNSALSILHEKDSIQSVLLLPLTTSSTDISIIVLAARTPNAYDQTKSDLIRFIGAQITHSFEKNVVMESLVISAVEGLAKLAESRDPETGDHLLRMSIYSSIIAQQLKTDSPYSEQITNQYIRDILRFAPMHDIGKVGIEDSILLKPAQLTDNERRIMQQHPIIGGDVLRRCESQMNQVGFSIFTTGIEIADSHHEKFDGSGYPQQLSGTDIPLSARIVAVADVFDALTSKRPYKEAWPVEKALSLLDEESGLHFDPAVINAFKAAMPEVMAIYNQYKHV